MLLNYLAQFLNIKLKIEPKVCTFKNLDEISQKTLQP